MRRYFLPELRCVICADPIDLAIDLCADENGGPIHEGCYVNRLITPLAVFAALHCMTRPLPRLSSRRER